MNKKLLRFLPGLVVLVLLLAHATQWMQLSFVKSLDQLVYDVKLRATMPNTVDERIVLVDIDEKSLAEVGRWPWRRDRLAQLLDRLFDQYKVRLVGFDLVLAEPDDSAGLKSLDQLGREQLRHDARFQTALRGLRPSLDLDQRFADAMKNRPVILGYYFANGGSNNGALPRPVVPASSLAGLNIRISSWNNFGANLPQFQGVAAGAGHFNPIIDADGQVRRVPLLVEHQGAWYESFALAMTRALLESPQVRPNVAAGDGYSAVESVDLLGREGILRRLPVDANVAALVPYRGPEKSFRYTSAADVLAARTKPEDLQGRVVVIGTSAPGLQDLRSTPVGEVYPGMEVHANLISGMLDQRLMERPQYVDAIELILLLAAGALMIFVLPWRSPLKASLGALVVLAGCIGINHYAWTQGLLLPFASQLLLVVAVFVLNMSWGFFVEARAKRQITQRFGQYVPPELVEKMSRDPASYSMASRKAELTVLFSDVRDFTSISEAMQPDALAQLMNEYLTAMTMAIRHTGGTLDKYIGDAIVAFWGAPVDDREHARHAVLTALAMQKALLNLNQRFADRGWPRIAIGIGVNTGLMTVGDMGSSIRLAYTVLGDAVNLGARLESKTKEYGVGIMVGQATMQAVPDVVFRELDIVTVKGKSEPVAIYEPIAMQQDLSADQSGILSRWDNALAAYRQQHWEVAESALRDLLQLEPESRLYALYLARIAAFRLTPPGSNWDGVTRFDTK